jgi:hypothetical protein
MLLRPLSTAFRIIITITRMAADDPMPELARQAFMSAPVNYPQVIHDSRRCPSEPQK